MKIQVIGSGCPTCRKLHEQTEQAVKELELQAEVEYSTDITQLIDLGVMQSPVLAIDDVPVLVGKPGSYDEIKQTIQEAVAEQGKE